MINKDLLLQHREQLLKDREILNQRTQQVNQEVLANIGAINYNDLLLRTFEQNPNIPAPSVEMGESLPPIPTETAPIEAAPIHEENINIE